MISSLAASGSKSVALLAEGVDRNSTQILGTSAHQNVALLAEGVDRNAFRLPFITATSSVALLAEGVDRNPPAHRVQFRAARRPPRGGRG